MTSTEFNVGLPGAKSSSRVLKPPGGGHSNIFGEAEAKHISARPKYDQQNSSNLNFCMNTTDPNKKVEQIRGNDQPAEPSQPAPPPADVPKSAPTPTEAPAAKPASTPAAQPAPAAQSAPAQQGGRRVPPGGFSSGLW